MQGHRIQGSDLDCFALEFPKIFIRVLFNFLLPLLTTTTTKNKLPLTRRIQQNDRERAANTNTNKKLFNNHFTHQTDSNGLPSEVGRVSSLGRGLFKLCLLFQSLQQHQVKGWKGTMRNVDSCHTCDWGSLVFFLENLFTSDKNMLRCGCSAEWVCARLLTLEREGIF